MPPPDSVGEPGGGRRAPRDIPPGRPAFHYAGAFPARTTVVGSDLYMNAGSDVNGAVKAIQFVRFLVGETAARATRWCGPRSVR